jgi:CRP/FNR family transcriptional regulator, cyclic AMP receptor protein
MADTPEQPSTLTPAELEALRAAGRRRRFRRAARLFHEGDSPLGVYLIESGRVKISYFTDDGREVLLAVRGPGELLGEMSAIDGEPLSATASAMDAVDVVVVSTDDFHAFVQANPRFALTLLQMLSRRLRDADRKRIEFSAYDTVGRVARRLVELAERFGEKAGDGLRITLPLSQQELAGWTGASREAVSKALASLKSRGWIETHRRGITVIEPDALRRRSS